MQARIYEGPRHGDYVRYVDELLRASPLYRSAAQGAMAPGRSDFTDALATPGAQPRSVAERVREQLREQLQAAAGKARAAAQQAVSEPDGRPGAAAKRLRATRPQAFGARSRPGWGHMRWSLVAVALSMALAAMLPGIGPAILLLTIIHALVKGFRGALKSTR